MFGKINLASFLALAMATSVTADPAPESAAVQKCATIDLSGHFHYQHDDTWMNPILKFNGATVCDWSRKPTVIKGKNAQVENRNWSFKCNGGAHNSQLSLSANGAHGYYVHTDGKFYHFNTSPFTCAHGKSGGRTTFDCDYSVSNACINPS